MKYFISIFLSFLILGCSQKQPILSQSATIVFRTPLMKFYDKGFIIHYDDYIHLQVLNLGNVVLDLEIYKDKICKGTLQCLSGKDFNAKYLNAKYEDNFMFELFSKNKVYFKDKKNNILIKIKKDK
jgi:hypothetical protein